MVTIVKLHPGYDVVEDTRFSPGKTVYIPLRLKGGLASPYTDDKGRHLSGCIVTDYPVGIGELFDDANNRTLVFNNPYHAHNFLNQWVEHGPGYGNAWNVWEAYQAQPAKRASDDALAKDLLDKSKHYRRLAAIHEAASELVRIYNEGGIDKEPLQQIVRLILKDPKSEEIERLWSDISTQLDLQ